MRILQLDGETTTSKKNKPKKLDNRHRMTKKSSPLNVVPPRHQVVDDHLSQASGRYARPAGNVCHQFAAVPTMMPPPPSNATVVVCVLASTGRADLWVRNNRGQTPLDLCPADQPLRRALIKCCDAAAQARNADIITPGANYTINRGTYTQFITGDPEQSKRRSSSNTMTNSRGPERFDPDTGFVNNSTANWCPSQSREADGESSQNQPPKMAASVVSATADLDESLQKCKINETHLMKNNNSCQFTSNNKNNDR